MNNMSFTKLTGDISELEFMLRATKNGLTVSKPYGDNKRYDFVTDANGVLKTVQVKSARKIFNKSKGKETYNITFGGKNYSKDVDILACYLIDNNLWYLIPTKKVLANFSIELEPMAKSKYNKYINHWIIFSE